MHVLCILIMSTRKKGSEHTNSQYFMSWMSPWPHLLNDGLSKLVFDNMTLPDFFFNELNKEDQMQQGLHESTGKWLPKFVLLKPWSQQNLFLFLKIQALNEIVWFEMHVQITEHLLCMFCFHKINPSFCMFLHFWMITCKQKGILCPIKLGHKPKWKHLDVLWWGIKNRRFNQIEDFCSKAIHKICFIVLAKKMFGVMCTLIT